MHGYYLEIVLIFSINKYMIFIRIYYNLSSGIQQQKLTFLVCKSSHPIWKFQNPNWALFQDISLQLFSLDSNIIKKQMSEIS